MVKVNPNIYSGAEPVSLGTGGIGSDWSPLSRDDGMPIAPAGITATVDFTPAAAAYSAGDVMGVSRELAFAFADGSRVPAGAMIRVLTSVMRINQAALQSGEAGYTLQCYTLTQPSAQADNDAWTLAAGDLASYRGAIGLGVPGDLGSACYVRTQYIDADINLATSSLWARLVTVGGFTATAVARSVTLHGIVL